MCRISSDTWLTVLNFPQILSPALSTISSLRQSWGILGLVNGYFIWFDYILVFLHIANYFKAVCLDTGKDFLTEVVFRNTT